MKKTCSVPGCRRRHMAKGFCQGHYHRHKAGRDLLAPIVKRVHGSAPKRMRANVKIDKQTGCHLWMGHRDPGGYGRITVQRVRHLTHRLAWELKHGPIPEGMIVMHVCDNPRCCNPEHLKLGTRGDNNRDRHKKGRGKGARARDLEEHPQWE